MSRQRQPDGINSKDIFQFKAFKFLNCEGRQALWYIFSTACPKSEAQTLRDYYINEEKMEEAHFKKWFISKQLSKIESDPSGRDFDITLLYRCLGLPLRGLSKYGSEAWSSNDETKLECLIRKVKDHRNDLSHLKEIASLSDLNEFAIMVTDLLSKTYKLAGVKYDCDQAEVNECISQMENQIAMILDASLTINDDQWQIMHDLLEQQDNFALSTSKDLKNVYKVTSKIHPASFLTHAESLQVQSVYTKLEVVEEQHRYKETKVIDHDSLLELRINEEKVASVIVVEGEAGMGKTTLVKLILAEWASLPDTPNTIHGLDKYELILHSECRNQSISTFLDLLNVLFSHSSLVLSKEELLHSVLSKKTLVLLDGVDEWNQNSKKLLCELVDSRIPMSGGKLQLLCTTRPEKVEELLSCLKPDTWIHTRIKGIHPDKQNDFITKFIEVMTQHPENDQRPPADLHTKTQGLKDFLQCSQAKMGEQFKLPLNLALLTYIWVNNSEDISTVKTATELYIVFHDLAQKRLLERLVHRQESRSKREWKKLCDAFLCVLYKECLIALSRVAMQMPEECTKRIENYCNSQDLPISDLLENYMEVYREWGAHGYLTVLAPPHKSKLEFFSAHGVINEICINHDVQNILNDLQRVLIFHNVLQDIKTDILDFSRNKLNNVQPKTILHVLQSLHFIENELDLKRYQNMLIMMAGILSISHKNVLCTYGPELIELLKKSGLSSSHQFLNIVAETKSDKLIARLVAENLGDKILEVSDGHIGSALAVLPYLAERTEVEIKLQGDPKYLPNLPELLLFVASRSCMVSLILEHQLHMPDSSADHLLKLLQNSKCTLHHLEGHLSSSAVLPNTLERLDLSAATGSSNPALPNMDHLSKLFHLDIHILPGVIPKHLPHLPSLHKRSSGITLYLYDVGDTDVEWANEVVRALCPIKSNEYNSLVFLRSRLSPDGCRALVKALADHPGIELVDTLKVSSKIINNTDCQDLLKYTKKSLRCKLIL